MTTLVTRWLVRLAVLRAIAIVLTGRMTQLEARLELVRRIGLMDMPDLMDLKAKLDALWAEERTAPPGARDAG